MVMVLKCDVSTACSNTGMEKPVDLVHLSRLTMGDRKLEFEILRMFASQIPQFVNLLEKSTSEESIMRSAHTIKGAARSIGAFKLANMAEDTEQLGQMDKDRIVTELQVIGSYIEELSKDH